MKNILFFALSLIFLFGCSKEEELLTTDRNEAYISRFVVRSIDNFTIVGDATIGDGIDTISLTINATARYGTDLTKLKPECTLSPESIMEPEDGVPPMGTWVDFTKGPFRYTVISGNREIRKTYTISVVSQ